MSKKAATPRELTANELNSVVGGVSTWRAEIEQVLRIGSASTGAGAGKITFNPF
jgi:bacteriocin-like protein